MASEHEKWRKFLKPVTGGLVVMLAAIAGYFQYLQKQDSTEIRSRVAALEIEMKMNNKHDEAQDLLSDNFRVMLSDIRSDVSFIRGKMEASK